VVLENPLLKGFPIFDLAQIEVARGPQGTLYGRNTPAGVVKFDSAKPSFDREGYFSVSSATYLTSNLEGAYNIPLSKTVALRVSGLLQRREDWVDNTFATDTRNELESYTDGAFRAQLLYQPTKTFSALFNLHTRQLEGTARLFRANIIEPGTNDLVDGFERDKVSIDGRNEQDLHGTGGSVRLRWDVGPYSLHSISGYEHVISYSRGDIDGGVGGVFATGTSSPGFIPFPAESADGLPHHQQLTQEFRVESNYAGPLNFQGGLYYFFEDITIDSFNFNSLAGGVQNGYARQEQQNNAAAVFGSATYELTPDFKLKGGVRYTVDNKNFVAAQFQSPIGLDPTGPLYANPDDTDVSWDASAIYKLTPTVSTYARVARGFRAPSVQGRLLFGSTLSVAQSETVLSYEAGIKADLFDKRARIAFNVFRSDVEDQQLTAVGGEANFNQLLNADKARLQCGTGLQGDPHRPPAADPGCQLQPHRDPRRGPGHRALRQRLHGARPERRRRGKRAGRHRRQPPAAGPARHRQRHAALRPSGRPRRSLRADRLGLPQQGQLLPVRVGRVHRQVPAGRRLARRLPVGRRPLRAGGVRPQHHQHHARRRRHRLQQPDRLHQRAADHRRPVPRQLLIRSIRAGSTCSRPGCISAAAAVSAGPAAGRDRGPQNAAAAGFPVPGPVRRSAGRGRPSRLPRPAAGGCSRRR
jgi:hypothetical protein